MNIRHIKRKALAMALKPGKISGTSAVLYFHEKVMEFYVKKTVLIKSRECNLRIKKENLILKKKIYEIKRTLTMLGFDTKKLFREAKK